MVDLNQELGTSLVVVTHNTALSELMERVYILEHGMLRPKDGG